MQTAFLIGLMATTAAAGAALTQMDVAVDSKAGCVLAKATPAPSPTPPPSGGAGGVMPKAKLTVRKSGGEQQEAAPAASGNTKWGNIALKRGATDCPKGE
jgi:hypothetical protein